MKAHPIAPQGPQMPPSSPGPATSRLERFLRLGPRGTEIPGPRSSGSSSSSSTAATAKKAQKSQIVKDARAVCLGEDKITVEDVAEVDSLAENVDSPEAMWRYLELLFLPQDRRMAQLLREWLRGGSQPIDEDYSEDVSMGDIQSQPVLPELLRAEEAMAQSSTIHFSWDWALEDAIAPKEQALGVYARLGIPPPRDLKQLEKSFPRVQLAGPDHTFDVRISDRPIRTRRLTADPFAYSTLLPSYLSNPLLQPLQQPLHQRQPPPPPIPTLLTTSVSSSSSGFITDQSGAACGLAYVPPESGPQLFSEPARARSSSDESSDFAPSRHRSHNLGDSTFRQLYEDLKSTFTENRELGRYILRNIMENVDAEEERGQATRAFIKTLSEAAAHHVMRLEYDHWINSVDELLPAPQELPRYDGKILVVFDDCISKIRARAIDRNVVVKYLEDRQERFMTGNDDVQQFSLTTRPLRKRDLPSEIDDDVSVPSCSGENLGALPELPQLGPFCHICRRSIKAVAAGAAESARKEALGQPPTGLINLDARQRSQMAVCNGVLQDAFEGRPGPTPCYRRFCHTCLVLYSHPAPIKGKPWTCPVCNGFCGCERCTRVQYIKEIRAFALANLGTGRLRDLISRPADEPREEWQPGFPVPWPQFANMAPNSSFIIQPDAEIHRQALEIENALARNELHKAAGTAAAKDKKNYTPRMSTRSSHSRQRQSGRSNAAKTAVASPAATSRSADTPPWVELHSPADIASAFLRELVPQGAGPTSTEKLLVLRKAVERLRDLQKMRLEAVDLLSQREATLAASLEGSGPQVLARSLLQPTPDWLPTDDLCIEDDDLADEFITALHRVLPEKRLRQELLVEDSDTEIEEGPPPDPSRVARNAVKWRRLTRRCGVRKPSSVALHPGRSRTKTAGDETDTEMMPPKHATRGRGRKPGGGSKRSAAPTIRRPDRFPAAVHYEIMDFV